MRTYAFARVAGRVNLACHLKISPFDIGARRLRFAPRALSSMRRRRVL